MVCQTMRSALQICTGNTRHRTTGGGNSASSAAGSVRWLLLTLITAGIQFGAVALVMFRSQCGVHWRWALSEIPERGVSPHSSGIVGGKSRAQIFKGRAFAQGGSSSLFSRVGADSRQAAPILSKQRLSRHWQDRQDYRRAEL